MKSKKTQKRFALIMAGGRGERLWPLSTPEKPKQFLKLGSEKTMLQETVARIRPHRNNIPQGRPLIPEKNIYVVTPQEFTGLVREQLSLPEENVIAEPSGRNTAPCVGLAAIMLEAKDPRGVMVVLPADHVIKQQEDFLKILRQAVELTETEDHLITLGIVPDQPATGYGYIRQGKLFAVHDGVEIYHVEEFTEKPDRETAKRFLKEGGYYWNSGMFIWRIDVILAEIQRHMPKLYTGLQEIKCHLPACASPVCLTGTGRHADRGEPDAAAVIQAVYEEQEPISIDYGVLERSSQVLVIPADIGWSDVGDWAALDAVVKQDEQDNIVCAQHVGIDTKNSIIYNSSGKDKLIATIGLENIVIIETEEALLVMDKARVQEVREIIPKL